MKDLNFLRIGEKLKVTEQERHALFSIIENDLTFLRSNGLMDYSLLFIKARNPQHKENKLKRMPALIYVKREDGNNQLILKEFNEDSLS